MNLIRAAALVALALGACNLSNPGFDAPVGELAYPTAIALSLPAEDDGRASHLYVANSNYLVQYNGASVQSYDLDALEQALRDNDCPLGSLERDAGDADAAVDAGAGDAAYDLDAADADVDPADGAAEMDATLDEAGLPGDGEVGDGEVGEAGIADAAVDARIPPVTVDEGRTINDTVGTRPRLCDGRSQDPRDEACCFTRDEITELNLRSSEVSIDSYATSIALSPDGAHVYVPLLNNSRLLYLDVNEEGILSCGTDEGRCQRGPKFDSEAEINNLKFPAAPTAVLSGLFSDLNVTGRGRYFVATAHEQGGVSLFSVAGDGAPKLLYTVVGSAPRAVSLRMDDGFFLVSSASGANIERLGARMDVPANNDRTSAGVYLYRSGPIAISGLTFDRDVRDAQPDTRDRALGVRHRYYALLRGGLSGSSMQSVAFLELDPSSPDGIIARAVDAVRVGIGQSKLVQADVGARHLLFVSCYQDGEIHVVDADARKTVTVIRDVLGPSDMQIDVPRRLLYVTDYRASVIRVVDLHGLFDGSERVPRVVATLGAPYLPGNVK